MSPYSEFFWSVFSRIWTEYGEILPISPYSVRKRDNADQKNSEYGHFLRNDKFPRKKLWRREIVAKLHAFQKKFDTFSKNYTLLWILRLKFSWEMFFGCCQSTLVPHHSFGGKCANVKSIQSKVVDYQIDPKSIHNKFLCSKFDLSIVFNIFWKLHQV